MQNDSTRYSVLRLLFCCAAGAAFLAVAPTAQRRHGGFCGSSKTLRFSWRRHAESGACGHPIACGPGLDGHFNTTAGGGILGALASLLGLPVGKLLRHTVELQIWNLLQVRHHLQRNAVPQRERCEGWHLCDTRWHLL